MTLRKSILLFILLSYSTSIAAAQDSRSKVKAQNLDEVLVPITKIEPRLSGSLNRVPRSGVSRAGLGFGGGLGLTPKIGLQAEFGTGFCLDAACRFVVTAYHLAIATKARKIKGRRIIQRYFATGPQDQDATPNNTANLGAVPYAVSRDLAIFELLDPIKNHHGPAYDLDEPEHGQEVDIYGYPFEGTNPFRKLAHFSATYAGRTTSGLLAFDLLPHGSRVQLGGASGGIVVDSKTEKIVGVLSASTGYTALAVPIRNLADFVWKEQPFLAESIFPSRGTPPTLANIYPKFAPPSDVNPKFLPIHFGVLERRPEEGHDVILLREKAQDLANSMRNFIAVQSYAWGRDNRQPEAEAAYEIRIIDGEQKFRSYPDGKKELQEVPYPRINDWALGSDDWSHLPTMVGTEIRLKIHQASDTTVNGQPIKVFQYNASIEDELCPFKPVDNYIFFVVGKVVQVACYGEVWTDENMNIVRISENLELSDHLKAYRGWGEYRVVITYGSIKIANEPSRLVPKTIFVEGRNGKHVYWCRGNFTDYQVFTSHATLNQGKPVRDVSSQPVSASKAHQ